MELCRAWPCVLLDPHSSGQELCSDCPGPGCFLASLVSFFGGGFCVLPISRVASKVCFLFILVDVSCCLHLRSLINT